MINVSIIGAAGYVGEELVRLLLRHRDARLIAVGSRTEAGKYYYDIHKNFYGITDLKFTDSDIRQYAKDSDLIFLATPHGTAGRLVTEDILRSTRIIDMGADFRLRDQGVYERTYNVEHENPELLDEAVYGLPELYRERIKDARLIANPGCYTTASILGLAPVCDLKLVEKDSIIIDAASGVTGAGRSAKIDNLFTEVDENFRAYGFPEHRHTPEIEQELSRLNGSEIKLIFTPHLVPMERGILSTCYLRLNTDLSEKELRDVYQKYYSDSEFVRIVPWVPETKYVKGSNYLDISVRKNEKTGQFIIMSAIDNLMKGAAGQAVENMNLMFDFRTDEGIDMIPACPI